LGKHKICQVKFGKTLGDAQLFFQVSLIIVSIFSGLPNQIAIFDFWQKYLKYFFNSLVKDLTVSNKFWKKSTSSA
jgi:hypothetical protein